MSLFGLNTKASLKRGFILLSTLCALLINQSTVARSGLFFNVTSTGASANVSISLCLNGKAPLSCQNYTVSAVNLSINTLIPNHIYSSAGIRINTPGYVPVGCTPMSNGYCLFSVSSTTPANIFIKNPSAAVLTPSVTSLALSVNCTTLTGNCVYANAALSGQSRQITITNTGLSAATNVLVIPTGFPSGTHMITNDCNGVLAVGASCIIVIAPGDVATSNCTTGIAPTSGVINVTADGASATQVGLLVLSYGCIYQGGYVYAINDTTPNTGSIGGKVASPVNQSIPNAPGIIWSSDSSGNYDNGVSIWGIDETSVVSNPSPNASSSEPATKYQGQLNCDGASDGLCNTNNIYVYYSTIATSTPPLTAYAVGLCKATINGYSDWYLPAICEMGPDSGSIICTSPPLMQLEQNMVDNLPMLLDNCTGSMCLAGDYWSSTEHSGNPPDIAWSECFASGGGSTQCVEGKSDQLGVRCSRVLAF